MLNVTVELGDTYMGYERWLPSPPKVEKPRSTFNATSLAYIGDCIYELYARRHFLLPPLNIEEYNDRVMAVVRCETQDAMLQKLINDNYLSQEERDVLRWGRNIGSAKTRTKKRAGVAVYNRASSLETLVSYLGSFAQRKRNCIWVGYLYLTNVQRLEEIMVKLGFSADASTQFMEKKSNTLFFHFLQAVRIFIQVCAIRQQPCDEYKRLHKPSKTETSSQFLWIKGPTLPEKIQMSWM
ncbi:uncharacterized protein LOC111406261 isoform X3 [Olea europaea var. sylvestris]|uniref:uncharacterized protein LOC111406261 isoform X3 n=1 Tax=Olea europaea var. sylvestris TaxID=158386 RepID=UPI000C1D3AF8|nr:uncharacterized protein LOC111406261 isoform X3 [Olea europaea var. sylvestris]